MDGQVSGFRAETGSESRPQHQHLNTFLRLFVCVLSTQLGLSMGAAFFSLSFSFSWFFGGALNV